jgi:inner membrane transporter RhtA
VNPRAGEAVRPVLPLSSRRHSQAIGALLLIVSCLAVQGSAAASSRLFEQIGAPAVAAWRQLLGALVLVVLLRPGLRGRDRSRWGLIGALGVCMAAMNTTFYLTVERLPLGVAASVLYLGPFAVAAASIRRGSRLGWPVLALAGVLAITRPDHLGHASLAGFAFGALAAGSLAGYTVIGHRLGRRAGLDDLALAVCASALVLTPISLTHRPPASAGTIGTLLLVGGLGVALTFAFDYQALRFAGPTLVATLFALDPAFGALVGLVTLGQPLALVTCFGLATITIAGIGLARTGKPAVSPPGP